MKRDVGVELLIEAFKEFVAKNNNNIEKTEEGAVRFLLDFLNDYRFLPYIYVDLLEEQILTAVPSPC